MNIELRNVRYPDFEKGNVEKGNIFIEDGFIKEIGDVEHKVERIIEGDGYFVLPGIVDSHTHTVFYGNRIDEFEMKLKGISYEEIHRRGGGIMNTVKSVREASEDLIFEYSTKFVDEMMRYGITTLEIKSGYGLDLDNEVKLLRVVKRLKGKYKTKMDIIATYLVHVIPEGWNREDYVKYVIEEVIPFISERKYADFIDIFCDSIAFNADESYKILDSAKKHGFKIKMHLDQISNIGGDEVALSLKPISVDHLEYTPYENLIKFVNSDIIPVFLPFSAFFIGTDRKPFVKEMEKEGFLFGIASDFNPGSSPVYNPFTVMAISSLFYRLTPFNVLKAFTYGGALALGLKDRGIIKKGYIADLIVTSLKDYREIFYYFKNSNFIKYIIKGGYLYEAVA